MEKVKKVSKSKQGKLNRASGRRFEVKVRADLEKMRWIVDKWANTIDLEKGKLIPAKPKFVFNHQLKRRIPIGISSGFPDFVCFKKTKNGFDVIGLEVKANGYLDKIERGMCLWLLENKIFSRILIAKKAEKRGQIDYVDFAEKHNKT